MPPQRQHARLGLSPVTIVMVAILVLVLLAIAGGYLYIALGLDRPKPEPVPPGLATIRVEGGSLSVGDRLLQDGESLADPWRQEIRLDDRARAVLTLTRIAEGGLSYEIGPGSALTIEFWHSDSGGDGGSNTTYLMLLHQGSISGPLRSWYYLTHTLKTPLAELKAAFPSADNDDIAHVTVVHDQQGTRVRVDRGLVWLGAWHESADLHAGQRAVITHRAVDGIVIESDIAPAADEHAAEDDDGEESPGADRR